MNKDIIMQALKLVIMVSTLIITRYVIPYLKEKTDTEKLDTLLKYIREGVRAAEQIFAQEDSRKKKYVMHYVGRILDQKSIPLTEEELELLVEAAVRTMNAEDCLVLSAEEYEDVSDDKEDNADPTVTKE